jgi:hypothetical protein
MNKPQVNINLNIEVMVGNTSSEKNIVNQIQDALSRAHLIQEQLGINAVQGVEMSARPEPAPPTSRHHQSVAANTRIMDAIEFINKEMRLLKGHSENGTLKVFEELKSILLGI